MLASSTPANSLSRPIRLFQPGQLPRRGFSALSSFQRHSNWALTIASSIARRLSPTDVQEGAAGSRIMVPPMVGPRLRASDPKAPAWMVPERYDQTAGRGSENAPEHSALLSKQSVAAVRDVDSAVPKAKSGTVVPKLPPAGRTSFCRDPEPSCGGWPRVVRAS